MSLSDSLTCIAVLIWLPGSILHKLTKKDDEKMLT